jgi:hypothetical protein
MTFLSIYTHCNRKHKTEKNWTLEWKAKSYNIQRFKSFSYTSRTKKDYHDCHEHKTRTNWTSNMARILYIKKFMDYTWTNNAHKPSLHCKNTNVNNETVVSISWGNNSVIICRLTSTKEQRNAIWYVRQTDNLKWKCNKAPGFSFVVKLCHLATNKKGQWLVHILRKKCSYFKGKKKVEITIFRP